MEEKILVVGNVDWKKIMVALLIVVAAVFVLSMVVCYIIADDTYRRWMDISMGEYFAEEYLPWVLLGTAVLAGLAVLAAWILKVNEMEITNKRICVKGLFGKRIELPNDAITAIGYAPLFKGVLVSTPSGKAGLLFLENAKDVYEVLREQMVTSRK